MLILQMPRQRGLRGAKDSPGGPHNRQVEGSKKSFGTIFHERSEPLAAYKEVGCNPSRPTIYFLLGVADSRTIFL